MSIRRNDIVVVRSGSQRGKTGKVLRLTTSKDRAIVEGVNLVKKHMRKSQDNPKGGIVEKEATLAVSALMLYCPHCKKGVKVRRVRADEKCIRKCKKCGHEFES